MMRGLSTRNYGAVVKDFQQRVWHREVGGERELHRGQPGESEAVDGASAGRAAFVRPRHRRHAVQGPADDCRPWDWLRWNKNGAGHSRRRDGKHGGGEFAVERVGGARLGLLDAAAVHPGWRQSAGSGRAQACRRSSFHPALPGSQKAQRRRSSAGRTQGRCAQETAERLCDDRLRRSQARTGPAASRVDGPESQRGAQLGGRAWKKRSPFTNCAYRINFAVPCVAPT